MTVEQKRGPKEKEVSLDFSFRELCKGPIIIWCSLLICVLVLVFTDHSWGHYYFYFLVAAGLLNFFIRVSDARFREKCFRLSHRQKNEFWLKP